MRVKIEKMGINGEGIGYDRKKPVFIPQTLIGEEVDIDIIENNRTFERGKVNRILSPSEFRSKPRCPLQARCGSCPLMIADYSQQLVYKKDLLRQSLIKYAQINPKYIEDVIANDEPYAYRNQCKLPLQMEERELVTGMYIPSSNYFISVNDCKVVGKGVEVLRRKILRILNEYKMKAYDYHQKKGIRSLVIRGFDNKFSVVLVTGDHPLPKEMVSKLNEIEEVYSLWQSINTIKKTPDLFGMKISLLSGERYLPIPFDDLKLTISPRSYFRINTQQTKNIYTCISKMLGSDYDLIVDAYCGIGGIALSLKDKAKEIIGIEMVKDAVVNANLNAKANHCEHVKFVCEDAAEKLTYISKKQKIDVLIVDPPRSGLEEEMISTILKSKIKTMIYVSCNPATLGKDLAELSERYDVKKIQPFDVYSQTAYLETVVHLKRR
ncbi:MAG: 23S rRNA (uracil(1939)-C(5))-methyltransferase RlmD [Erysipelotrichaceae bacterium]